MIIAPLPQKKTNTFLVVIITCITVLVVAFLYFRYYAPVSTVPKTGGEVACTTEAKLCPDGSYVARSGPSCAFADCPTGSVSSTTSDLIQVYVPLPNAIVKSPLTISGEARGTWYFEASFPVQIYDANGKLLGGGAAQAKSDWMTENFVPFTLSLKFTTPTTTTGRLVFEKDNPSGLPQNDNQFSVPIRFK